MWITSPGAQRWVGSFYVKRSTSVKRARVVKSVLVINQLLVVVFDEAMSGDCAGQRVSLGALLVVRGHGLVLAHYSPVRASLWALCTRRSRIASASVASPIALCQFFTGSWLVTRVERTPWRGREGQAAFYRQIAQADTKHISEAQERYREPDFEVHLAWGERDTFIPPDQGDELRSLLSANSMTRIQDAAHIVHEDAPEAIVGFLLNR